MSTRELLLKHYKKYPKLQIADVFKFLYQSSFGSEHLVASEPFALEYIRRELEEVDTDMGWEIDPLDGKYSRIHLSSLGGKLTPEALTSYFCLSAKVEPDGARLLSEKLEIARELIEGCEIPLSLAEFDELHASWREAGYPAIHHSEIFRSSYSPHYRVIANEYIDCLFRLLVQR